jgi:hypothetical protein
LKTFSGTFAMSGTPSADNPFDITGVDLEDSGAGKDTSYISYDGVNYNEEYDGDFVAPNADSIFFMAKVGNGFTDGFDFSINGNVQPSFLGFDILFGKEAIFVGAQATQVEQDGKFAAPVPEPATMLLLGTGLLGASAICRRKYPKRH